MAAPGGKRPGAGGGAADGDEPDLDAILGDAAKELMGGGGLMVDPALKRLGEDDAASTTSTVTSGTGASLLTGPAMAERIKKWIQIYPCYMNVNYTAAQGRKLPKSKLVGCVDVTPIDIAEACAGLGFKEICVENFKRHPRDFRIVGRVRVNMHTDGGEPVVPAITTRARLMEEAAKSIPTLASRLHRIAYAMAQRAEWERKMAAATKGMVPKKEVLAEKKKAAAGGGGGKKR